MNSSLRRSEFLVFGAPLIQEEEINELVASLKTGWIGTGPKVEQFENLFRSYKHNRHAVALNSCTAALHLSMLALEIGPGDEVVTTPLTFCSTVNSIIHAGATPVLVDVNPEDMNIDPQFIEKSVTERTRCILPVHFAGRPCEMDTIMDIADRHQLSVIEDCAHAIETQYQGKDVGTFGDLGCFSFYATKNVVTGEGGMVITDDEEKANRIKRLSLHGMSKDAWKRFSDEGYQHYFVEEAGFKYNMIDLQAALGIHQLARVEKNWYRRQEIWDQYNDAFCNLPIKLPAPPERNTHHAYHLYTILIDEDQSGLSRDEIINMMHGENIGTGVHYLSIPEHPYYQRKFGWKPQAWPHAMSIGRRTLSLPLSAKLSDTDVDSVIGAVYRILS